MKKKKKKMSTLFSLAATATVAVSSFATAGSVLAAPADQTTNVKDETSNVKKETKNQATISAFTLYNNADLLNAYNKAFKIDNNKISAKNNAGHYSGSPLSNIFDGNQNTHWETNKQNSESFTNELTFTFDEVVTLNRIVYAPRVTGAAGKGFPLEFEIQGKSTDDGEYKVVATGSYSNKSSAIQIQFESTEFKELKFVFKNAEQGWAAASEMMFYTEDPVIDKVNELFTDGTMSKLTSAFDTLAEITALENEAKTHPLYEGEFKEQLDLAKKIVNGELEVEGRIITAEQNGDMVSHAKNNLKFGFGNNNQPIGISAQPGEKVTIYVEADGNKPLPQIVFGQQEGSFANWQRSVKLNPGKNVITVPEVSKDNWYKHDVVKGGTMYIYNPYTEDQQGEAPVIRVEGGERVPFLTADTDPEEFKEFLIDYKERLDADVAAHPNVADRELIDVVEVVSDHLVFTGTATGAYQAYITDGYDPSKTVATYNKYMSELFEFYGLDGSNEKNDPKAIRENIRLAQPFGYMYAYTNHIGIQGDVMVSMLKDGVYGWGVSHEIGHRMDVSSRLYGESTNNMIAMQMGVINDLKLANRIPYAEIYKTAFAEDRGDFRSKGYFTRLGAFWQLEMYSPGYWAELNKLYRERDINISTSDEAKMQKYLVELSSEVIGEDVSEFFERHGFKVTDETKEIVSEYPKSKKAWYLNDSAINYKGDGFTDNATVDVNIALNEEKKTNTLTFKIDEENKNNVVGYEIHRDGVAIGFTDSTTYTDSNIDPTKNYKYEVVAYDKKLNELAPVEVKVFKPTISVPEQVTLKLNQEFNALDYVKGYDYKGNDITDAVKVKSSTVKLNAKGNYQVVYEVANQGITETKTLDMEVVSDYDYLSELKTKSATVGWGSLKLDKSSGDTPITILRDGKEVTYAKGLGAHANSEIVYDVEGKGYDSFETYIGIDHKTGSNSSSATFEVWVDNEKVYESERFGVNTESKYLNIPITGAKEVKLITTDAKNYNTSDHTVWADAKFAKDSSKPVISVKSVATKVGEPIKIEYKATDAEDGNLTDAVKVVGVDTIDFNTAGEYKISFTVEDRDGNEVTENRTVSVVDMDDFTYLSDYDWTSEKHSYAAPNKNVSMSGKELRLTSTDSSVVTYKKGIGAHSTSTIVYDLTDKDADYFTSYVGVDRQMYNTVGSVGFQVFVDGEKKFDSGTMASKDAQQYVEVNLAGAKELKLVVTDGGNGNGSDHATWGDAKLHYADKGLTPEKTVAKMQDVVKEALSNSEIDLNTVDEVYASNPKLEGFKGTDVETKLVKLIEEALKDVKGKYAIYISKDNNVTNVDEILGKYVTIQYEPTEGESYTYSAGSIKQN